VRCTGTSPGARQGLEFQIVPCRDGHVAVVYTVTQWPATRALIATSGWKIEVRRRAGRRKHITEPTTSSACSRARRAPRSRRRRKPRGAFVRSSRGRAARERAVRDAFVPAETKHPVLGKLLMPQLPVQWTAGSFAPRPARRWCDRSSRHDRLFPAARARFRPADGGRQHLGHAPISAPSDQDRIGRYPDPFRVVGKPRQRRRWWNARRSSAYPNRNKRGLASTSRTRGQRVIRVARQALR